MARMLSLAKWFYPGMHVKRWLLLTAAGVLLGVCGLSLVRHGAPVDLLGPAGRLPGWIARTAPSLAEPGLMLVVGVLLLISGVALVAFAMSRLGHSVATPLNPRVGSASLVDMVYRDRYLAQGPRVVVIGGGTGLSTMLRGLKQHTSNIVAVVTVTDDGGSSGRLQQQLNIPPPGDIRNCLVALSDQEGIMTELFQFRFRSARAASGLRDHAFGNLLIGALTEISGGDFEKAVRLTSRVLNIRGTVLASTLQHVNLRAEMEDGTVIAGETSIVHSPLKIRRIAIDPGDAAAPEEVTEAIRLADVVVVGPGSVFTSVIPNLLVGGIAEALYRSRAPKVYVCNVMTQPGETDGFSASDHLKAIEAHVPRPIVDHVIVNTAVPSSDLLQKYRQAGAVLVEPDCDRVRALGYRPITGAFISQSDFVRHDHVALAQAIVKLLY